jgi:hypothetical protein
MRLASTVTAGALASVFLDACGIRASQEPRGSAANVARELGASDGGLVDSGPPSAKPCVDPGRCTSGVWRNVTPSGVSLDPNFACSQCNYGVQDVVVDPVIPGDLYAFICYQGVWRSRDYGVTWTKISKGSNAEFIDAGRPWMAAIDPNVHRDPSTPPTLWTASGFGPRPGLYRSTDGGSDWTYFRLGNRTAASVAGAPQAADDVYSLDVDPNDSMHLIAGFHGNPGVSESMDGGQTWNTIDVPVHIGDSLYVFFVRTGSARTTRTTWLTQAQHGAHPGGMWRTADGGRSWLQVQSTLEHVHGSTQIVQDGLGNVYAPGSGSTPGVWRSPDYGRTWSPCDAGGLLQNAVFATPSTLYAMNSAAVQGTLSLHNQKSPRGDGIHWSDWSPSSPPGMTNGPKRVAVTFDGSRPILVSGNWLAGIWRYVE